MKLISAKFENYRFLRDLELQFSTDQVRRLTVIRAANDTGKTTILLALQWVLFGELALPDKGTDFRLHPIDWDISEGQRVPISGTVNFEVTPYHQRTGIETRHNYQLVRSTYEEVDGNIWHRSPSTVKLFELTDRGAELIDPPEAIIKDILPFELREVFFTDGDRALSFIEANRSTKRERVENAVRSLLGLGVIEEAIRHVQNAARDINKKAKRIGTGSNLNVIVSKLETIEDDIDKFETKLKDAKEQFVAFDLKIDEIDKEISGILAIGDREKIGIELEQAKREMNKIDAQIETAQKEHSSLFRKLSLARDLLASVLEKAFRKLEELHDQGKIPKTTISVLEDRLSTNICICGESLNTDDKEGKRRRENILKLINDNRRADEIQATITDLYYDSKSLEKPMTGEDESWLDEYQKVLKLREDLQGFSGHIRKKYRAQEALLDGLPDTDIQSLRETRREYLNQRDRFLGNQSSIETTLAVFREERERLKSERDNLLRDQEKGRRVLSELEVNKDVMSILNASFERIINEELSKVSELMNQMFLEMIGIDPEQGAIINRAEISKEFDILVFGPDDRMLNPDRDLNGASRRALTLAFILALTKVSEREAPNVIDTPLGMMSDYVKNSVLRVAIKESAQLILFLTRSEIIGCEEILDNAAGRVITLTNPAHYPKILVFSPLFS